MRVTLSREQMLAEWLRRRAVEPVRLDCTVSRTDGPDIAAIASDQMRRWYLRQLDTAPAALLAPTVMAGSEVQTVYDSRQRLATLTVPAAVRRVLWLEFGGEGPVAPRSTAAQVARAASNPLWGRVTAATVDGGRIVAAGFGGPLVRLCAVVDPGPETYEFDDALWNEMTF